jgi:hypothetical protein
MEIVYNPKKAKLTVVVHKIQSGALMVHARIQLQIAQHKEFALLLHQLDVGITHVESQFINVQSLTIVQLI